MTRVLIVDDKEDNLYYLQALLGAHGYEVDTARHGAEALVKARKHLPELVVADLLMPIMDGYTLLRHWKADELLRPIPFVVYTATYTEVDDERLAFDLGADDFILKPCEPDEFVKRLSQVHLAAHSRPLTTFSDPPSDDASNVFRLYSRTLIRKLEEKSIQLEASNQALKDDMAKRVQVEAERAQLLQALTERVKELRALFKTAEILRDDHASLPQALAAVVELLPGAISDPARAAAKISWGEHAAQSDRFLPAICRLQKSFQTSDGVDGQVQLVYRDGTGQVIEFLPEERELVSSVAEQLRGFLDRRLSQQALRSSEARLRAIFDNEPECVKLVSPDGILLDMNPAGLRMVGATSSDQVRGKPVVGLVHPDDRPIYLELHRRSLNGEVGQDRFRIISLDGTERWMESHSAPLPDSEGGVEAVLSVSRDATEELRAHEALQQSEARFREMADNVGEIFFNFDPVNDRLVYVNRAYEEIWGRPLADAYEHPETYMDSVHPADRTSVEKAQERLMAGEQTDFEYRIIRPDQQLRWVHEHAVPVFDASGAVERKVGSIRDISARKQTDERIRVSEERFRLLAKATNDAIWDWDLEDNSLWWSDGMEILFGFRVDELEPGIESWTTRIHPDEREAIVAEVNAAIEDGALSWNGSYRFARSDGQYAHVHDRGHIIRNGRGKATRMVGGLTDVSDQHRAEKALEQSLIDLGNRNRELQDFAFIASHDLQEPLRKIRAFADILQQRHAAELPTKVGEYLSRIDQASTRMQTLIDDLLAYSRVATRDFRLAEVDLAMVCKEVMNDLEDRIESSAAVVDVGPLPTITADPLQMRQLLQNLLANALKFRKPDQCPEISVTARPVMIDNIKAIELSISDNGIGFDSRFADKIFNPFQRLHARTDFEGSGIGLAIVRRIVERHRGRIATTSAPGEGATFKVSLPLTQARDQRAEATT